MSKRIQILDTTARQELIRHAASRLSAGRTSSAHMALEAVVDGARPGTIGGAMLEYYQSVSSLALERLIGAVGRAATSRNTTTGATP